MKPPYAIGQFRVLRVTKLSTDGVHCRESAGTAPASKPQSSAERVLPWQVTMGQLICASLSHTHYWYEVDMLKVPAFMKYIFCLQTNGTT